MSAHAHRTSTSIELTRRALSFRTKPSSLTCDSWVGSGDGVHIYDPWSLADSDLSPLIGKIVLPTGKGVANFCWAGAVLTKQKGHAHSDGARVTERGASGEERGVGQQYRLLLFAEDELWEAHVGVNGRD